MLGHYRLLEKIGEGGMGEVYRARDEHLGRDVAIKLLPLGTLGDEHARKRFRKEAEALSKLEHPNIATIHDFDTQGEVDFIVMEYISGEILEDKLRQGPLPEKEVVRLGLQLAEGLAAAHEHGVIHRDLKPGNLRLTSNGRLKILDFGLAKLARSIGQNAVTESIDETGVFVGTLPYMAPEQVCGEAVDRRTDIYGAGVALYEMATGQRPFSEKVSAVLMDHILHQSPVPPGRLCPQLSPRLEDLILKCLEKEPINRYQSAGELAVDLRRVERDSELRVISKQERVRREPGVIAGRRRTLLLIAAIVVAAMAIAGQLLWKREQLRTSAPIAPTIAVLPFVDMSPDNQEYFSDGLAEEVLNTLSKIEGVQVVARTSSFQFKGKNEDLRTIGQKLNVATILEGSVRRQADRVRISVQLISAADGFHLWSEIYDRQLKDIFDVQEEIAQSVASSLKVKLLGGKAPSPQPTSVEAYNAYLQGKYFYAVEYDRTRLGKAIAYYEQAIKLDPDYAPAWAGLSIALSTAADYSPSHQELGRARQAAERALALDRNLADGYAAMGKIKYLYDWDWAGAESYLQQALSLEPRNSDVLLTSAELEATLGRFEKALLLSARAVEVDPLSASAYRSLAWIGSRAGRRDQAESAAQKALELNPELPWAHVLLMGLHDAERALDEAKREKSPGFRLYGLALTYHALARKDESDQALAELIAKYSPTMAFQIAEVYAYRGETDLAFAWLERAYAQHDTGLTFMKGDVLLKSLERDPRYAVFLTKMRLPA